MHSERHVLLYGTNPLSRLKLDNGKLAGRGPGAPGIPVPPPTHPAAAFPALPSPSPRHPGRPHAAAYFPLALGSRPQPSAG